MNRFSKPKGNPEAAAGQTGGKRGKALRALRFSAVILLATAAFVYVAILNPSIVQALFSAPATAPGTTAAAATEEAYAATDTVGPTDATTQAPSPIPDETATAIPTVTPAAPAETPIPSGDPALEGYKPWDELSKDLQKELKEIYSPEDLDMLFKPRRWVIMPNVVGMTRDQACATLRNTGIVPRVIYEDSRNPDIPEGVCFAQEGEPGLKHNTDASIFIWIQRSEHPATSTPEPAASPSPEPAETPAPTEAPATPSPEPPATDPPETEPAAQTELPTTQP